MILVLRRYELLRLESLTCRRADSSDNGNCMSVEAAAFSIILLDNDPQNLLVPQSHIQVMLSHQ